MKKLIVLTAAAVSMSAACARGPSDPAAKVGKLAAQEGHDQGNGADVVGAEDGAAWFIGANRTVKFCVNANASFGYSKQDLEAKVMAAFATWREYMRAKRITSFEPPEAVVAIARCDGTQDVRFLFGIDDADVTARRPKFNNPAAMTIRDSIEEDGAWAKGTVWVAQGGSIDDGSGLSFPNWTLPFNLDAILLHEIGHIHGVGHVDGTIMQADIANSLNRIAGQQASGLRTIDGFTELAVCPACDGERDGYLGIKSKSVSTTPDGSTKTTILDTTVTNFSRLMGRASVGDIRSRLEGSLAKSLKLVVGDSVGETTFELTFIPGSNVSDLGTPIFKRFQSVSTGAKLVSVSGHASSTRMAMLTTSSGEKLALSVLSNAIADTHETSDGIAWPVRFGLIIQDASGSKLLFSERIEL